MYTKSIKPARSCVPAASPHLVPDFLVPALNEGRYGESLSWLDKKRGIFRVKYKHKNTSSWNPGSAAVFMGWDQMKGRCRPGAFAYFTKSRQRFKAAALKSPDLFKISNSNCRNEDIFQLRMNKERQPFQSSGWHISPQTCQTHAIQDNNITSSEYCARELFHHDHRVPEPAQIPPVTAHHSPVMSPNVSFTSTNEEYISVGHYEMPNHRLPETTMFAQFPAVTPHQSYVTSPNVSETSLNEQHNSVGHYEMQNILELLREAMSLENNFLFNGSTESESSPLENGYYFQTQADFEVFQQQNM